MDLDLDFHSGLQASLSADQGSFTKVIVHAHKGDAELTLLYSVQSLNPIGQPSHPACFLIPSDHLQMYRQQYFPPVITHKNAWCGVGVVHPHRLLHLSGVFKIVSHYCALHFPLQRKVLKLSF